MYEPSIVSSAEQVLKDLLISDRRRCREIALILLSLRKNPRPAGSRELDPDPNIVDHQPGERVWEYSNHVEILYAIDDQEKTVTITHIILR